MREIFNGIFYVMRAGCAWRLMPSDLRPWETTYRWFAAWLRQRRKKGGKFGNPLVLPQTLPHRPSTAHAACARRRKCARRKRDYTRAIYRAGRAPSVSREIREAMLRPRCMAIRDNDRKSRAQARVAPFAFGPTGKLAKRSQKR